MMNKIDEGRFTDWFKQTFNAYKSGQTSFNSAAKQVMNRFDKYRGSVNQDWDTVTWGTLYKFLTIPTIFAFTNDDIKNLVRDPRVAPYIQKNIITAKWNDYKNSFLKQNEPIGGNEDIFTPNEREQFAQLITNYLLKLATVQLIDRANKVSTQITEPTDEEPPASPTAKPTANPAGPLDGASQEQLEKAKNALIQALKDLGISS